MIFEVTKCSDWNYKNKIEINTFEELISFVKENGKIVFDGIGIEIYDYYRE